MNTDIKDLVIGRMYKVKPAEWFGLEENKQYKTHNSHTFYGCEMVLDEIVNKNVMVLRGKGRDNVWLKRDAVDEIPGQKEPTKVITDTINKLKKERFILGYDMGPGGGDSGTIDLSAEDSVLPAILNDGQYLYIPVDGLKRMWTVPQIREFFSKGKVKKGFQATQHSYMTTELSLIKDKKKLPERSGWTTSY